MTSENYKSLFSINRYFYTLIYNTLKSAPIVSFSLFLSVAILISLIPIHVYVIYVLISVKRIHLSDTHDSLTLFYFSPEIYETDFQSSLKRVKKWNYKFNCFVLHFIIQGFVSFRLYKLTWFNIFFSVFTSILVVQKSFDCYFFNWLLKNIVGEKYRRKMATLF